ncbi:MAG TPA: 2-succinyl-6-hydroxy-2,4-cyclohexadiene-1-carboxylate synthase [Cerasibacillus sp.]|uniref:2-succinyl-6-hydroxy-2, 4-cyclohexadiene-1-carboxylate synthase n=1 Tax=Cerasibacillus sp. TaxID=2498711 RepID=UPI002F415BDC
MYLQVNDATYWYELYGKDHAETLVLFHGFTSRTTTWHPFIADFQKDFQVLVIDLPGHGKTKTPPRTMHTFCADFEQILAKLSIISCHLLGYSMGGRTALSFAMLYPERVKSLILESASPGLRTEQERATRVANDQALMNRIMNDGIESFVNYWENMPLFNTQKSLPKSTQRKIREERLSQTENELAHSLKYMGTGAQPSWWEHLNLFSNPVFLLVGEKDNKFIHINKQMDDLFPQSQFKMIENAGHAIHVEQPEKFGKIVLEFIHSRK